MIKVVLVDDHRVMREGLRAILASCGDIEVVGEAADGVAAVREVQRARPDVLVLDLSLPLLSGLDVLDALRTRQIEVAAVVLSMHDDAGSVREALQRGARAYLPKGTAGAEVVQAVRTAAGGRRYLSTALSNEALDQLLAPRAANPLDVLSPRERQVMRMVCDGATSAVIAERLHVSPRTIDTYRARLMDKLAVDNVPALVKLAIRAGMVSAGADTAPPHAE